MSKWLEKRMGERAKTKNWDFDFDSDSDSEDSVEESGLSYSSDHADSEV